MAKQNTFSLYLAKPEVADFDDLLTENALKLIKGGSAKKQSSNKLADGAVLYTFPGDSTPPKWVDILKPTFSPPGNLFSQSPCAIVAFKQGEALFAISFSYGHVYLDDAKTEADFGLKVAINAISDEKLRSVERSNIGEAIRDFAQAAGQRDLHSFGFDDALDLIRKVSGYAADSEFADMVSGSRSLRFSKKIKLTDVPDVAADAIKLFSSKAYKKTSFKIIDLLSPVLDPTLEEKLNKALVESIRDGSDEFEIAIPQILPESVGSFRFERAGCSDFHADLSLDLYREGLGDKLKTLAVDDLKRHAVTAYADSKDTPQYYWSVFDAIVGSVVLDANRYALNEGAWYCISKKFKEAADQKFIDLCGSPDKKLRPLKKISQATKKGKKSKIYYQSEESYNQEIAKETGYLLLDKQLVEIDEKHGRGIEICDLLDIEGRRFIHVKKSSRQSSVLSHFFKQGGNSAQMLKRFEPVKIRLIELVEKLYGDKKAKELEAALKETWTVEFQIADFPRADGKHTIPFFSKLTLQEEASTIAAMGFKVRVGFITLLRAEKTAPAAKKAA